MLPSRKIRLQPAEELPQSQDLSPANSVEILETIIQGYDCWCIFWRLLSGVDGKNYVEDFINMDSKVALAKQLLLKQWAATEEHMAGGFLCKTQK